MFDDLPATHATSTRGRGRALTLAVGVHAALIAGFSAATAVAVDPMAPPTIAVQFFGAVPPPRSDETPPPAKPEKRPPAKPAARTEVKPAVPPVVQPEVVPETPATPAATVPESEPPGADNESEPASDAKIADGDGVPGGRDDGAKGASGPYSAPNESREPLRLHAGIVLPQVIDEYQPLYPPVARAGRIEGEVVIEAVINTEGRVEQARALSGPLPLRDAARDAALQWRFKPALLNGRPVAVYLRLAVHFRLH